MTITIINLRHSPAYAKAAIAYFQAQWASPGSMMVYEDCITRSLTTTSSLPQWYLLMKAEQIIGGAGLITNDFISCFDLWPWLCGLHIDKAHRGQRLSQYLVEHIKQDVAKLGFKNLYLGTDHIGLYEKMGFAYLTQGYHPWGQSSRVYTCLL